MANSSKLDTTDSNIKKNSKLRACVACSKEIGKSVKVCPNCGTKQKRSSKLGIFLLCIGLFWFLIDGLNGASKSNSANAKTVSVGEAAQTDKYEIVVVSADVRKTIGSAFYRTTAGDGAMYLAVRARMKNITKEPISVFSRPDMQFIDANGVKYSRDTAASGAYGGEIQFDGKVVSDLNPGIITDLMSVFEISQDILNQSGWKIEIDADQLIYVQPKGQSK